MPKPKVNPFLMGNVKIEGLSIDKQLDNLPYTEDIRKMTPKEYSEAVLEYFNSGARYSREEFQNLMENEAGLNLEYTTQEEQQQKEKLREKAIKNVASWMQKKNQTIGTNSDPALAAYKNDIRGIAAFVNGTSFTDERKQQIMRDLLDPAKRQDAADAVLMDYIRMDMTPFMKNYTDEELVQAWPSIGSRAVGIGMEARNFIADVQKLQTKDVDEGKATPNQYVQNKELCDKVENLYYEIGGFYSFQMGRLKSITSEYYPYLKNPFNDLSALEDYSSDMNDNDPHLNGIKRMMGSMDSDFPDQAVSDYTLRQLEKTSGQQITACYSAEGKKAHDMSDFILGKDFAQGKEIYVFLGDDAVPTILSGSRVWPPVAKEIPFDIAKPEHKKVFDARIADLKKKNPDVENVYDELYKTDAQREADFKALLKTLPKPKDFEATEDASTAVTATISEYSNPYFRHVLSGFTQLNKAEEADAREIILDMQLGKSLSEIRKDPLLQTPNLQLVTESLYMAAKVDQRHEKELNKMMQDILVKEKPANLVLNPQEQKGLPSRIEAQGIRRRTKAEIKANDGLRKTYLEKLRAASLKKVNLPKVPHRIYTILMMDPSLPEEDILKLAEMVTTPEGKTEYLRRMVDETLSIDIDELKNLSLEEYVNNFEKYNFGRILTYDDSDEIMLNLKNTLGFTDEEADQYHKIMQTTSSIFNKLNTQMRVMLDPTISKYDFSTISLADMGANFGNDGHDNDLLAVSAVMNFKQNELNIQTRYETGVKSKENLLQNRWVNALKSKPDITESEKQFLDNALTPNEHQTAKDGRIRLYSYALQEIHNACMQPGAENSEYRKKLQSSANFLRHQMETDGFEPTEEERRHLELAELNLNPKQYRQQLAKDAREAFLKAPTDENFKAAMDAVNGTILNQIEYPSDRDSSKPYQTECRERLDRLTTSHVRETMKMIGLENFGNFDFIKRVASGMTQDEIENYLISPESKNMLGRDNRNTRAIKDLLLMNADKLAMAGKLDAENLQNCKEQAPEMFRNIKEPDPEEMKTIMKMAGIPLLSEEEQQARRQQQEELKVIMENDEIRRAGEKHVGTALRPLTVLRYKPGIRPEELEIIDRAFTGSREDINKCYDMVLEQYRRFDINLLKNASMEDLTKNYDQIHFMSLLSFDGDYLFSEINKDRKNGDYQMSDEEFNAAKEFKDALANLTRGANTLYKLATRPENLLIDPAKMTINDCQSLYTVASQPNLKNDSILNFYTDAIAEITHQQTSLEKVEDARSKMMGAHKDSDVRRLQHMVDTHINASIQKIMTGFNEKNGAQMRDGVSEIMYFSSIRSRAGELGQMQIEKMTEPEEVQEVVEKLNPVTGKIMSDIPVVHFQHMLNSPEAAEKLAGYLGGKFANAIKQPVNEKAPEAKNPENKAENKAPKNKQGEKAL